ncbi:LysM peptidoglycan-binding domain-containing protein [Bacillus sp. BRMEA1]|uniref:LysM peptidoglycan-binding domain-containing protein n=1 Tax=Neobacillus endophyticus TaxID=2738405 RepID=UPI001567A817|nr:LysM peptidoglycan-binding domain-containing protein [Neobacillus endophyticus]NRD80604.1 LysM peptidoglycan-binding domain-containing protein [Neobacillus endophyticus]
MNKEEPYREQAEKLKQRIEKVDEQRIEGHFESGNALPPREQRHRQKKKKIKWKIKYPVIRLLVVLFILLPVIIFSVISFFDGKKSAVTKTTSGNTVGETINLEKPQETKQNKSQVKTQNQQEVNQENSDTNALNQNKNQAVPATPKPLPVTQNTEKSSSVPSTEGTQLSSSQKEQTVKAQGSLQETKKSQTTAKTQSKVIYHTVQPKETLYMLAERYYHSSKGMEIIIQANHLSSDQLMVGQVLKIPLNN